MCIFPLNKSLVVLKPFSEKTMKKEGMTLPFLFSMAFASVAYHVRYRNVYLVFLALHIYPVIEALLVICCFPLMTDQIFSVLFFSSISSIISSISPIDSYES